MKKQQFGMSQQEEIEQEEKKLPATAAEKEAYENNCTARAIEKATDELERLRMELDKGFFDDEQAAQHNNTHHQARRRL